MPKLIEKFKKTIHPELQKKLGKNYFETPKVEKVVVSAGIGDWKDDKNSVAKIAGEVAKITGQKAKVNRSKKAVSAFKLRIGQPVGLTTTLRGERMYDFIDRFVNITLPRVRDFRGLNAKSFDNQGNFSIGLKDYSIFPEIKYEDISINFGLEVNIKTTAENASDAKELLLALGFPFDKKVIKE